MVELHARAPRRSFSTCHVAVARQLTAIGELIWGMAASVVDSRGEGDLLLARSLVRCSEDSNVRGEGGKCSAIWCRVDDGASIVGETSCKPKGDPASNRTSRMS